MKYDSGGTGYLEIDCHVQVQAVKKSLNWKQLRDAKMNRTFLNWFKLKQAQISH